MQNIKVEPNRLLPGLPSASYLTDDSDQSEQEAFYFQRAQYIKEFGFCLLTAECLVILANLFKDKRVLEAGSGSGWLTDQLARRGADIIAADWTDYRESNIDSRGYQIRTVFRLDHHGDAVSLLPGQFDIILMVYPNFNKPFAENVANAMKPGQILVFEGEGKGGCTASDEFFEVLDTNFEFMHDETAALNEHHRTFPCMSDWWRVLRKIA